MSNTKLRIAVFASGNGTNAENIFRYFKNHLHVEIALLVCNRPGAAVLDKAAAHHIPSVLFNKQQWQEGEPVLEVLKECHINLIVLAGFLWLLPEKLVAAYPNRIVNIHPALLPKYGGKGMYGSRVHDAVKSAGETETGITIHYVNNRYDEGEVIFQKSCAVESTDTPESIALKVHGLEYKYYPAVIEEIAMKNLPL